MTEKHEDPARGLIRVFVYGTLKHDGANHALMKAAKATFVGYDSITGPLVMTDMCGFPGIYRPQIIDGKECTPATMKGEVWAMEPEGLAALDLLEGHPHFYRREKWWTDREVRAWVYIMSPQTVVRGQPRGWFNKERILPEGIWNPSDEESEFWEAA